MQGVWHTIAFRAQQPGGCETLFPYPITTHTWFEMTPSPGVPGVATGPLRTMSNTYGDFVFNTTALPAQARYQYRLDGSSWSGCNATLRVGPLSVGEHTLLLRTTYST